ncbi:MAG: phosphatase PAP2 family protein [Clostridiales bacterium]|nr:phosphatase PAP2 family protein [Candidatus Equinaster intestinalis]
MNEFEIKILDFIQQTAGCKALDFIMPIVSLLGDYGIVCIALSLLLIIIPKTRKMGIQSGLALFIGLIVCNIILKPLIFRTRPFYINDFNVLVERLSDGSFPSGHALSVFETATVFMIRDKRFGIPALVLAFLISFSRLYLYMHYPSDVIAGIIIGTLIGFLSVWIVNKVYEKYVDKIKEK